MELDLWLDYYESLNDTAIDLKEKGLDISIKEVNDIIDIGQKDNALTHDTEKIINLPKLTLK